MTIQELARSLVSMLNEKMKRDTSLQGDLCFQLEEYGELWAKTYGWGLYWRKTMWHSVLVLSNSMACKSKQEAFRDFIKTFWHAVRTHKKSSISLEEEQSDDEKKSPSFPLELLSPEEFKLRVMIEGGV